jgi:WD40 repeat protein
MHLASHNAPVYALCMAESNEVFFSGGGDKVVAKWNVKESLQLPFTVRTESPIYALVWDSQSSMLFIGCSEGKIHAVNAETKAEEKAWSLHHDGVFDLKIDHQRRRLLAAGGDGVLSVWDLSSMQLRRTIPLSEGKLRQLALSPDGRCLAVTDNQGPVHVLDGETFHSLATLNAHADGSMSAAWHPTKPVLLTGGKDAYLRCWNAADNYKEVLNFAAHLSGIYSIVFLNDGKRFATCSRDKSIKIWDAQSLDPLQKIEYAQGGHKHSVNKLLVLDSYMVSAGDDRQLNVFGV